MNRFCELCHSNETYRTNNGYQQWYIHNGNYICKYCRLKLIDSPKWNPISNPIHNKRKFKFRDRDILFKENPKKGICVRCGLKKGDRFLNSKHKLSIVKTNIHHIEYHDDDPLRDTIELCDSCHRKEHWRLKSLT